MIEQEYAISYIMYFGADDLDFKLHVIINIRSLRLFDCFLCGRYTAQMATQARMTLSRTAPPARPKHSSEK